MSKLNIREFVPGTRITEPGVYRMNINDYHSDCCDAPSFSSGDLVTIYKSGEEYWYKSPYNPNREKAEHFAHLSFGNAAHARILDPKGWQNDYILRPSEMKSWRSEAAKNWRMVQERGGKIAITADEVALVDILAEKIQLDPVANAIFSDGEPELSIFVRFQDIWIKCRPDKIPKYDWNFVNDYKTTSDNSLEACERDIEKWGYAKKLANIAWCMKQLPQDFPEMPPISDMAFALLFQKSSKPAGITCMDIDPEDIIELASENIQAATDAAKVMRGQAEWKGYSEVIKKWERRPWVKKNLSGLIEAGALPKLDDNLNITGGWDNE